MPYSAAAATSGARSDGGAAGGGIVSVGAGWPIARIKSSKPARLPAEVSALRSRVDLA